MDAGILSRMRLRRDGDCGLIDVFSCKLAAELAPLSVDSGEDWLRLGATSDLYGLLDALLERDHSQTGRITRFWILGARIIA